MTEIVAAHLERVAKELEDWIIQLAGRGPSGKGGTYVPHAGDLAPRLAAALAACAREARNDEAVDWRDAAVSLTRAAHEKWMEARMAELRERAAGEKAPLDPQGGQHES